MIVRDLQRLLEMLPGDMGVIISAGAGCHHIETVDKAPKRRHDAEIYEALAAAAGGQVATVDGAWPPMLILRAAWNAKPWFALHANAAPYQLTGHWPAAAEEAEWRG